MAIGEELKNYTWDNVMNMMMGEVSDEVDKRQGGIIYDTLSPAATALMVIVNRMISVYHNTFIGTAQGEYLDKKAEEFDMQRIEATNAIRRVVIYDKNGELLDVDLGTNITPKGDGTLLFTLIEKETTGTYKAMCNQTGVIGNKYKGECEIISNLTTIGRAEMTDVISSAREEENDEELRQRCKESTGTKGFGGNITDYKSLAGTTLTNVAQMQVYPRIATDKEIILSVVNGENKPMSNEELQEIQTKIDPYNHKGEGVGIAPIGHYPVVVSPKEIETNVYIKITPASGRSVDELKANITSGITEYIEEVRNGWAKLTNNYDYQVVAYISQITAKAMSVDGVLNVNEVKINDKAEDYTYTESRELQEIPVIKNIVIE